MCIYVTLVLVPPVVLVPPMVLVPPLVMVPPLVVEPLASAHESSAHPNTRLSIGVISFYSAQVTLIRQMHASGAAGSHRCVKIDTVDSFQGSEADIIILSFVRSSSSIGFLRDFRRLNVALTRARKALFVVCDTKSLAGALPQARDRRRAPGPG